MIEDKFSKCPVCNNAFNSSDAIACRFCGFSAINFCTGENCERACESNAYYCELCGSKTILGQLEPH